MSNRKASQWYDEDDLNDEYDYEDEYYDDWEEYEEENVQDGRFEDQLPDKTRVQPPKLEDATKRSQKSIATKPSDQTTAEKSVKKLAALTVSDVAPFTLEPGLQSLCDKAAKEEERNENLKNVHLVVLGHVDAGKSTLMGRMLYETGMVGDREVSKAQKEAKALGKGSFAWAWMLDERPEERKRGVTVDVAMARFETKNRTVFLLDAPGHRDFVPNMISGASQADAALLVVDGSEGAFESGMSVANPMNPSGGGQTREHVQLAASLGIEQIAIVVTKLDTARDPESRFAQIKVEMSEFVRICGFDDCKVMWTIAVGLTGDNLTKPPTDPKLTWFKGQTVLDTIDSFTSSERVVNAPLRMAISEAHSKGAKNVVLSGKVHQGATKSGQKVVIVPPGEGGTVKNITIGGKPTSIARAGDPAEITVSVTDPSIVKSGSVLCILQYPLKLAISFRAQITVLDVVVPLLHGQSVTLHAHAATCTGTISKLLSLVDAETGQITKERPRCLFKGQYAVVEVRPALPMPVEPFSDCKALGRVAMRDGGRTLAVGTVIKVENEPS